jgi:hypothetical protein
MQKIHRKRKKKGFGIAHLAASFSFYLEKIVEKENNKP